MLKDLAFPVFGSIALYLYLRFFTVYPDDALANAAIFFVIGTIIVLGQWAFRRHRAKKQQSQQPTQAPPDRGDDGNRDG